MSTAKKVGRIKTTVEMDMYLEICDYDKYAWKSDEGEKVFYGVKTTLHLVDPESTESFKLIEQNRLIDAEKIDFKNVKDVKSETAAIENYILENCKDGLNEADAIFEKYSACKRCGEGVGFYEDGSGEIVYAKCGCNLTRFAFRNKCEK
ncbi:hypothetical protein Bateq7PJ16_2444 [Bacillus subtilis]|uniref:hypothetical protein n=1 Tax=Bacillus subtilis TaxID=1423 RepID=UPI00132E90EC|nr:hypothetical protein [Bacillus subtilis]QHF58250.1 hypothetical protein Bateq7PJ16_2444 [Bacillus subtilis]